MKHNFCHLAPVEALPCSKDGTTMRSVKAKNGKKRLILQGHCASIIIKLPMDLPVYTKQQLALRNGQDKPQIWVAYKGLIYDMTDSRLWRNGKHYEHWAGQDLTDELPDAPHTSAVFEKFEPVGELKV